MLADRAIFAQACTSKVETIKAVLELACSPKDTVKMTNASGQNALHCAAIGKSTVPVICVLIKGDFEVDIRHRMVYSICRCHDYVRLLTVVPGTVLRLESPLYLSSACSSKVTIKRTLHV